MAISALPKMTADEFFALPGEQPHTQLIDGVVVVTSPRARHNRIILWLSHLFMNHSLEHPGSGEAGIAADLPIDEHNVYVPDLWWVPQSQRLDDDQHKFPVPPPLVVEVRSPSTWRYDVGTKLRHYESVGVSEAWLVDTAADVVLIYRRSSPQSAGFDVSLELTAEDQLTTPLVPRLEIDLRTLFGR